MDRYGDEADFDYDYNRNYDFNQDGKQNKNSVQDQTDAYIESLEAKQKKVQIGSFWNHKPELVNQAYIASHKEKEGTINVVIQGAGDLKQVPIISSLPVSSLKKIISDKMEVSKYDIELLYAGQRMESNVSMEYYGVEDGSLVYCIMKSLD